MKKIFICSLTIIGLFILSAEVNAKGADQEKLIEMTQQEYLQAINKHNYYELTKNEEIELTKIIDSIKKNKFYENVENSKWYNPYSTWTGYIYVTNEGIGHAGIGGKVKTGQSDLGYTIEAYPNVGVKLFSNRYRDYWRYYTVGGIYKVKNAPQSKYEKASTWAEKQIGKPYSLNPTDGDKAFYCSELVYRAWKTQGYTVGTMAIMVTPASIMNHKNTILVYPFAGQ